MITHRLANFQRIRSFRGLLTSMGIIVLMSGCAGSPTGIAPNGLQSSKGLRSPLGFTVFAGAFQGYDVESLDAQFRAFNQCIKAHGFGPSRIAPHEIKIHIVQTPFTCNSSPTGLCDGKYVDGEIYTDPDLRVFFHELAHAELDFRTGDADGQHRHPMFGACGR